MPALGKSLGLWYRVKYQSDGTYFDAQGYTLINKLQDKEKELKIGAVLSVRYSGKVEMCEIVQVGKTKKAVWQENGTSENKEQCPGNTAKKATEKTNQKSKDKTSQKSKENDINKEKDKMSKKKKEMDVKKDKKKTSMSREKNKENNKEGNKRKVKQKKKQDQENQGATAGMTAANECSDKTLQKRQRDNTQREILRLHDLNRDPEGLNNEPIMEQSSSTYGISEGVNDFIPAGRKRDNGHVVPMPATAEMSSVLTRLSMMEGKMERHEERISGVEERFNDAFKDNTTQLKEVFKILAEMKADRPSPRSPLRQSPQQQAPLRQSPLRQSPLRQSPQWQSPQWQSPQRQSPQWQSPQQQSPQQQLLQQQSPQQQSILQQQSPQQQSLLQQQTPLQQPETTTGLIPPAALKAALEEVDARKATKALLLCMFGKEVLATHSFRASARKPALDQTKTSAIINTVIHNFPQCKTYGLKNTRTKEAAIARFIGDTCQDKHRLKDRLLAKLRPSHQVPPPTSLSFPLTSASASPSSNGVLSSAVSSAMISYM